MKSKCHFPQRKKNSAPPTIKWINKYEKSDIFPSPVLVSMLAIFWEQSRWQYWLKRVLVQRFDVCFQFSIPGYFLELPDCSPTLVSTRVIFWELLCWQYFAQRVLVQGVDVCVCFPVLREILPLLVTSPSLVWFHMLYAVLMKPYPVLRNGDE